MGNGGGSQQTVEKRWPSVWQDLEDESLLSKHTISRTQGTPQSTLVVDGIHLTSSYNRLAEARLQASMIPEHEPHVWVYGLGLGDLPRVLLERRTLERLTVVVLSSAAAKSSLELFDHMDWLTDERVELELAKDHGRAPQRPFGVLPAALKLCDDASVELRDELHLRLAAPFQLQQHQRRVETLTARARENGEFLEVDGDVATLYGSQNGGRVAIVAAGPTLSEWFPWIEDQREDLTLIAVTTALVPLQKAGIDPDIVVVIEHHPASVRHLDGIERDRLRKTQLVYAAIVDSGFLSSWPGPRLSAYLQNRGYRVPSEEFPKGELFSSGSVTHSAVDLAVRMGAAEVTLLGADFCYPGESSHVAGATMARDISPTQARAAWVINGHGRRVPTDTNMLGYLRDLETYVERRPEVRFLKGGRDGARVRGVDWRVEAEGAGDGSA